MKITSLALLIGLISSPLFADSQKTIAVPKDSEIGRFEIHSANVSGIPIFLKIDTVNGYTWKLDFGTTVGSEKVNAWIPVVTVDHEAYADSVNKIAHPERQ